MVIFRTPMQLIVTVIFLTAALAVSGCSRGLAEFAVYENAYDIQFTAGSKVLDSLSTAERTLAGRVLKDQLSLQEFKPNLAGYYVVAGDAPITASLRSSLSGLRNYNKVLMGLANGDGARLLAAEVNGIATSFETATKPFAMPAGVKCVVCPKATDLMAELFPAFEEIAKIQTRGEFRTLLVEKSPKMKALLTELRNGTPAIYEVIRISFVKPGLINANAGVPDNKVEELRAEQTRLAAWVLLLDQTVIAMDAAVKAVAQNSGPLSATELLEASIKMQTIAAATNADSK